MSRRPADRALHRKRGGGDVEVLLRDALELIGEELLELFLDGGGISTCVPDDLRGRLVEEQRVEQVLEREVFMTTPGRLVLSERERDLDFGADTHRSSTLLIPARS